MNSTDNRNFWSINIQRFIVKSSLIIITRSCVVAYNQLDFRKRCQIYGLWRAGYNQSEIAKEIGVHKSTISREFKRNITFVRTKLGSWQYKPNYAQGYTDERHKEKQKHIKFTNDIEKFVREKISHDWSPDQISGYAKRHNLFSISHEWIYQFILKNKNVGGKLYLHLRHQHKRYRKRYGSPKRECPIKNRKFIEDRPKGDWEIDTIIGKQHKQAIVTIMERVSKIAVLKKVKAKTSDLVSKATVEGLKKFSNSIFTITADSGTEFSNHEKISKELSADFYFAYPYASWERGLNENTNGLIRQYLRKGCDFSNITDEKLDIIMDKLNSRPRKNCHMLLQMKYS